MRDGSRSGSGEGGSRCDESRARGALLGLAVGDALGTTLEFSPAPAHPFAPPLTGPHRNVIGKGPLNLKAGQVTDDTEMALALAGSLIERRGFEAAAVAQSYISWSSQAVGMGIQTTRALAAIQGGKSALDAGRTLWVDSGRRAAGNGSLMRTLPIALYYQDDPALLRQISMDDSAITHFDPRCQLACAAYNSAIAAALRGPTQDQADMLAAARDALDQATAELTARYPHESDHIASAATALTEDLNKAEDADPELYSSPPHLGTTQGFVRVAFRLAFWQLTHAHSFESALVDVVNRGGDADTNGAIVGGLLGAYWGDGAIPDQWSKTVLSSLPKDQSAWGRAYHPTRLLDMLSK